MTLATAAAELLQQEVVDGSVLAPSLSAQRLIDAVDDREAPRPVDVER